MLGLCRAQCVLVLPLNVAQAMSGQQCTLDPQGKQASFLVTLFISTYLLSVSNTRIGKVLESLRLVQFVGTQNSTS